ncbi:MAG: exodeoxyribonuclease VII small subunit [Lachnospiraceae bacterium]|jgi:exodeoxyribonuclease VII small subunit|nr:exodeoxyribonuclease VII small subunit [Lachnospiraceae bacterium]
MSQTNQTIEEAFTQIDEMIRKLQNPDTSLQESFQIYEQGMKAVAFCNDQIDGIEKKIEIMTKEQGEDGV